MNDSSSSSAYPAAIHRIKLRDALIARVKELVRLKGTIIRDPLANSIVGRARECGHELTHATALTPVYVYHLIGDSVKRSLMNSEGYHRSLYQKLNEKIGILSRLTMCMSSETEVLYSAADRLGLLPSLVSHAYFCFIVNSTVVIATHRQIYAVISRLRKISEFLVACDQCPHPCRVLLPLVLMSVEQIIYRHYSHQANLVFNMITKWICAEVLISSEEKFHAMTGGVRISGNLLSYLKSRSVAAYEQLANLLETRDTGSFLADIKELLDAGGEEPLYLSRLFFNSCAVSDLCEETDLRFEVDRDLSAWVSLRSEDQAAGSEEEEDAYGIGDSSTPAEELD